MRYVQTSIPQPFAEALRDLARAGAASLSRPMTQEEAMGLERWEAACDNRKMPGHAPGHHRGPEFDMVRRHRQFNCRCPKCVPQQGAA